MIDVESPNHPLKKELGTHKDALSRVVYLERSDFRLEDSKVPIGFSMPQNNTRDRHAARITLGAEPPDQSGGFGYGTFGCMLLFGVF